MSTRRLPASWPRCRPTWTPRSPARAPRAPGVTRSHEGGVRGVAVPAVDDRAGVDRDDVAVLEDRLSSGMPWTTTSLPRCRSSRGSRRTPGSSTWRRDRRGPCGPPVQIPRRGARHGGLTGRRVDRGDDQPCLAHLRDLLGGLDLHHGMPSCIDLGSVLFKGRVPTTAAGPADIAAVSYRGDRRRHRLSASMARSVTSATLPSAEIVTTRPWAL